MNLPKFRDFQTDKAMTCKTIEYMQLHLTCNKSIPGMSVIFNYEATLFHA